MNIQELITQLSNNPLYIANNRSNVNRWDQWYSGYVPSFHQYSVYNGKKCNVMRMSSLQMAKKVSEDWADLLFNERVGITLIDDKSNENFRKIFKKLNGPVVINQGIEWAFAQGTVAFVLTLTRESTLALECVKSVNIYPITTENNRVTECAFISYKLIDGVSCAYVSIHRKNSLGEYTIENAIYSLVAGSTDILGATPVKYWTFDTHSTIPWFAVYTPNSLNNFDDYSPFGISVFANAIAELQSIDNSFDAIENEVTNGRMRIIVGTESLNIGQDGVYPVFDARDTVFHQIPKDINDRNIIETIAPKLRTEDLISTLNSSLAMLCNKCGLSSDYYIYSKNQGLKTATEVISSNSPMYRRIKKHEIILEDVINTLVAGIANVCSSFLNISINAESIYIQFDDSIIQDTDSERKADLIDIKYGILPRYQYRMKWYNEDELTAKRTVEDAVEEIKNNPVDNQINNEFTTEPQSI